MKTLKKTLCLVLAVVMAVGVLVIPASAAGYDEFTDKGKIEHTTAVAVLNGMGIIDGKENNNFDPTGTLTRGEAAKMVVYALLGKTSAEKLSASASKFSDVAGHWAAKYISYAAQLNVLQGNGDGTVEPEGKLTGYALAKMLLVAADVEGTYIGADWENNVMLAATQNGFLKGIETVSLSAEISRDNAAQMVWNAVNYSPEGETIEYVVTSGTEELYRGGDATMALVLKLADDANKLTTDTVSTGSIGDKVYGLKKVDDPDPFGRTFTSYINKNDANADPYAKFAPAAAKSYTTSVKLGDLMKALGKTKSSDKITINVKEDGVPATLSTTDTGLTQVKDSAGKEVAGSYTVPAGCTFPIGGRGTVIDVYKTGDSTYDVIIVNTYVDVIEKKDIKKADANEGLNARVVLEWSGDEEAVTFDTTAFKADDVVIYTKVGSKAYNAVLAPSVTGSVAAVGASGAYVRVDSTNYATSKEFNKESNGGLDVPTAPGSTVYTFYLDSSDNIIFVSAGPKAPDVEKNYVYVVATAAKNGTVDKTDLFTSVAGDDAVAQAKIVDLETGDIKIVNQAIAQNTSGAWFLANADGSANSSKPLANEKGEQKFVNGFYQYVTNDDGDYIFIGDNIATQEVNIKAKQTSVDSNGLFANSSTKVTHLVLTKKGNDVTKASVQTVTGYANFPTYTKQAIVGVSTSNSKLVTSILYTEDYSAPETKTYAIYGGVGETVIGSDGTPVTQYLFYIDGEGVYYTTEVTDFKVGQIYAIAVKNDVVSKDATQPTVTTGTVGYYDGELISVADKTGRTGAAECLIVDAEDDFAPSEDLAEGDSVAYVVEDNAVVLIVINYNPAK